MMGLMLKVVLFAAFTAFVAVLIAWYMQESFDPESLRGKKVVICGASTGIGEELAYQYAKFGAQLLLVARREAELKKVVARCGELGAESANYVVADLSSLEGAKHLTAVSSYFKLTFCIPAEVATKRSFCRTMHITEEKRENEKHETVNGESALLL